MSSPTETKPSANANAVLVAGVVLVLAGLVAYIYCEQIGINSVPVLGFVGPFAAALLIAQKLDRVQRTAEAARTEAATTVRQTNGELTAKVTGIVREELRAAQTARDASKAALVATLAPPAGD